MNLSDMPRFEKGDIVKIFWDDATLRSRVGKEDLLIPCNLLEESLAIGEIRAMDHKAITLVQNSNNDTYDLLTIPLSIISNIKIFRVLKGGKEK